MSLAGRLPPSLSVADGPLMGPRCRCSRAAEVLVWLAMTIRWHPSSAEENSILTGLSEMARAEVLVWLAMTMENSILTGLSEMVTTTRQVFATCVRELCDSTHRSGKDRPGRTRGVHRVATLLRPKPRASGLIPR